VSEADQPRQTRGADADRVPRREGSTGAAHGHCAGESAGAEARGMPGNGWMQELVKPTEGSRVSTSRAGKVGLASKGELDASMGGGVGRSTEEVGQRARREGATQG